MRRTFDHTFEETACIPHHVAALIFVFSILVAMAKTEVVAHFMDHKRYRVAKDIVVKCDLGSSKVTTDERYWCGNLPWVPSRYASSTYATSQNGESSPVVVAVVECARRYAKQDMLIASYALTSLAFYSIDEILSNGVDILAPKLKVNVYLENAVRDILRSWEMGMQLVISWVGNKTHIVKS